MAEVNYEDEYTKLRVLVRPASHKGELRRQDMQEAAASKTYADVTDQAEATWLYPRLICTASTGELTLGGDPIDWPPTLEQFGEISDDAINAWYVEAKRLNPNWFPSEEDLKKMMVTAPSTESSS